jgi:hypothetical protein
MDSRKKAGGLTFVVGLAVWLLDLPGRLETTKGFWHSIHGAWWLSPLIIVVGFVVFEWDKIESHIHGWIPAKFHPQFKPASEGQVTANDWKELAQKFDEFTPSYVRAEWMSETLDWNGKLVGEFWLVRDDWNNQFAPRCQALCEIAGAMLAKSPKVSRALSKTVKTRSDNVYRWLYFISEKQGVLKIDGHGTSTVAGTTVKTKSGTIHDLPAACSTACLECAAKEV